MMKLVTVVMVLCMTNFFVCAVRQLRTVIIERLNECINPNSTYPFQVITMRVHRQSRDTFVVDGVVNVHETITGKLTTYMLMTKCAMKDNPNTCEVYMEAVTDNICDALTQSGHLWSNFFQNMNMEKRCPIKEGNYTMTDAPIDMSIFAKIPTSLGYWKIRGELRNSTHVISCVEAFFLITPSRRRAPLKKLS